MSNRAKSVSTPSVVRSYSVGFTARNGQILEFEARR